MPAEPLSWRRPYHEGTFRPKEWDPQMSNRPTALRLALAHGENLFRLLGTVIFDSHSRASWPRLLRTVLKLC